MTSDGGGGVSQIWRMLARGAGGVHKPENFTHAIDDEWPLGMWKLWITEKKDILSFSSLNISCMQKT